MTAEDIRKLAEQMDVLRDVDRIKPHATKVLRALADVVEQGLLVEAYIGTDDETGGRFYEAMKRVEALKP